jgi:hypothetical protein
MRKQNELTVKDIYPAHGSPRTYRGAYDKQEEHIFKMQSVPLLCPCCNEGHTVNELYVNSPDYKPDGHVYPVRYFCPVFNEQLNHCMGVFAGNEWLERTSKEPIKPPQHEPK